MDVGNLISVSSAFSKSSLNIWSFMVQVLLKPDLENFEHYFISVWDECSCTVVWTFFSIALLWDWNENWCDCIPLILMCVCVCVCAEGRKEKVFVVQLCLTLCDTMDYSAPGSSVHGILQARILEWVAMPFSRGSSRPRDQTQVSCISGRFFTIWATKEAFICFQLPSLVSNSYILTSQ